MKKITFVIKLCLLIVLLPQTTRGQVLPEREKTTLALNWELFMNRQNMVWEVLPTTRNEAPFMGNGKLGLLIYKDPQNNALLFATGHAEATNHLKDASILGGELLPTGNFILTPKGKILRGHMTLDLWNAETTTEIWTDQGRINIISFVHADDQMIINRITTEGNEPQPEWTWKPASNEQKSQSRKRRYKRRFVRSNTYPEGGISTFKSNSGGETAALWYLSRQKENNTLYITINHAYPDTLATELGKNEFRMILRKGYKRARNSHRNWWHNFYSASFVSLPDAAVENFYWAQMYKMGSSMREDGIGIIHGEPYAIYKQWPNRLWNFNVHSIYIPINGTNHNELALPLEKAFYDTTGENSDTTSTWKKILTRLSRKNNNIQSPVINEKEIENGQLVWACQNLWTIYRHKMDDNLLRYKLYPLLREATNRYINQLHESDGTYHLTTFYHRGKDTVTDNNFDLAMLRWGCQTMLSMSRRLQIEDPQITLWQRILKRLTPLKTQHGILTPDLIHPELPLHLLSIYPLYTLNVEVKENRPLIRKSITDWIKKNECTNNFPFVTAASLYATERNGNKALEQLHKMIHNQVECNSTTNADDYTPGLAGAQAILNMLIQSWNGIIRVFPAVSDKWQDIAFYHLRTEGAFLVSAKKEKGQTTFVEVTNTAGELCTIELDFDNPVFDTSRRIRITRIGKRTYNIPIRKGESVRIYPQKSHPDFEIRSVKNGAGNFFGKKR